MRIPRNLKISVVVYIILALCLSAESKEKTVCKLNSKTAEIGVQGYEKFVFVKEDGKWRQDGLFISRDGKWVKVAESFLFSSGDGARTGISNRIHSVSKTGKFSLRIDGDGFVTELSHDGESPFIDRKFLFTFADKTAKIEEHDIDISFSFENCRRERGFIGSYCEKDHVAYLFSPFPALYSRLENTDGGSITFTQVVDFYGSSPVFRKARRLFDPTAGKTDIGVFSCPSEIMDGVSTFHDRIMVSDGAAMDFYDQLSCARTEFSQMYPVDHKAVASKSRLTVDDYSIIACGLENELMDSRAQGPFGAMRPYAYSDFGGESFIGLNIYRSMVKYAKATGNSTLYDFCLKKSRMFVNKNDRWIEDAYGFGDFFHYARSVNDFSDRDNSEIARSALAMGTFKGFERVDALGEVALFTDDHELKEGFLRLAKVIHEKMVMPGFCQPVCYSLPELKPLAGVDDGGSAGGAALWADIMLMASEMTEGVESAEYLSDAVSSAKRAAEIGFQQMWSILDAPKSVAVSRTVSTLVELWKKTGDRTLLDSAAKVVNGLYHFYHYFNQSYSPFCTGGMSGACSIEKQEAAYESMLAIWQVAPLLDYVDDYQLLDLFVQSKNSGYYFYPVNGQGIGTIHSIHRTYYEWPESQYVPYEFASGVLHDPSVHCCTVDLTQSIFRETKEIYGSGETFAFDLLFDGKAFSPEQEVCCICTSANLRKKEGNQERFVIYNSGNESIDAPLIFRNLEYDSYDVIVGKKTVRKGISARQLENGIVLRLGAKSISRMTLRQSSCASAENLPESKALKVNCHADATMVSLDVEEPTEAAFYKLSISRSPSFNELNTNVSYSTVGRFRAFVDGMEKAFCRIEGIGRNGDITGVYETQVNIPGLLILAQDDFARKGFLSDVKEDTGWREINTDFRSDGSRAVMNILSEDVGYGYSEVQRSFDVDCSGGTRFEIMVSAIPDQCALSVFLGIDGKEYTVADKITSLDEPVYSYDLGEITGLRNITVRVCTEGYVRGCILECVRFVSDSDDQKDRDVDFISKLVPGSYDSCDTSSGVLHINNTSNENAQIVFDFDADLSRTGNLVIDVENFSGMNESGQWQLFLKDCETLECLEIRNMYEIHGFNPDFPYDSYRNPSNLKYYRSKSGVYMYDVSDYFKESGLRHYELCLSASGRCEMDIPVLYLTESNAQVPVTRR